ncbi:MAG: FGGY family carbohydrate kinase [Candidatus Competibacteraceae bacterium]|nr:FGGY family carbohydrate kinase [Candidatus Competibacteraceae bacterium]
MPDERKPVHKHHLIGLDIGTTSVGGVLIDGNSGEVLESAAREHQADLDTGQDWERVQDPETLLAAIEAVLGRLTDSHPEVRGLGITGQMHSILYVDQDGRAVSPLFTWQDQRGDLARRDGKTYVQALAEATGHSLATGFGLVTHHYNLQNGLVPATAASLCTISDYVASRLTGGASVPALDATQAAGLGLFDLHESRFDPQALRTAGIDQGFLPPVAPSGTLVGHTEQGMAVFLAPGDNQAGFLGAAQDAQAAVLINVGTSGQVSVFARDELHIKGLEVRPFPGDGFLLVGSALCGGKAYAVLEKCFRHACRLFAGYDGPPLYATMGQLAAEAMAGRIRGERLTVDTRLLGTRSEPQIRGSISRVSLDNFTPEHLILGFLEGIAEELGQLYERLPETVRSRHTYLVGCGNGLRLNQPLCKVIEDRFGLPLRIPQHREEAAFGAALCAGVGLGLYPDFIAAGRMTRYV